MINITVLKNGKHEMKTVSTYIRSFGIGGRGLTADKMWKSICSSLMTKGDKQISSWKSCIKTQGWHVGHIPHVCLFYRWVSCEHPCISSAVHGAREEGHIPHVPTVRHLITFSPHVINAWSAWSQLDHRWECEWGPLTVYKDGQQECSIPKHCDRPLVKSFSMGHNLLPLNNIRGHMVFIKKRFSVSTDCSYHADICLTVYFSDHVLSAYLML